MLVTNTPSVSILRIPGLLIKPRLAFFVASCPAEVLTWPTKFELLCRLRRN